MEDGVRDLRTSSIKFHFSISYAFLMSVLTAMEQFVCLLYFEKLKFMGNKNIIEDRSIRNKFCRIWESIIDSNGSSLLVKIFEMILKYTFYKEICRQFLSLASLVWGVYRFCSWLAVKIGCKEIMYSFYYFITNDTLVGREKPSWESVWSWCFGCMNWECDIAVLFWWWQLN